MRLWHKDLIDVLPRQQLLGQWRECCLIIRQMALTGTPHHILVNKILDYPLDHFVTYALMVQAEMERRGYKCDVEKFNLWLYPFGPEDAACKLTFANCRKYGIARMNRSGFVVVSRDELFGKWHDWRYLQQCYYNLEEKHDCGGISDAEWLLVWEKACYLMEGYL